MAFRGPHQLPPQHYDWYWNNLKDALGNTGENLRNRFNRLQNKVNKGKIPLSDYYKRLQRLTKNIDNTVQEYYSYELEGYELDTADDVVEFTQEETAVDLADEEIVYKSVVDAGADGGEFSATLDLAEGGGIVAEGGSSIIPSIGIGVGTGVIVGGFGLLAKLASSGGTLPQTNYIGPGGSKDAGKPLSGADYDAQKHDKGYDLVPEQVRLLDHQAEVEFGDHFAENHLDIPALLGHGGIKAKQIIEKQTGILYPSKYGY